MGTQCKLYTDVRQAIEPNTWTTIKFDVILRDDNGMYLGSKNVADPNSALIKPKVSGDFIWSRLIKWDSIVVPEGDVRRRQFQSRFVRNPYTAPNNTGEADDGDTVGQDIQCVTWQFWGTAANSVAVEVCHNHHLPVDVIHAQFCATTWDY